MRVAANRFAAIAIVGQQLRLVAHANLAHLDARPVFARQILDQIAEIDALLGQEIKDEPIAAEKLLDIDQFHLQSAFMDEVAAAEERLGLASLAGQQLLAVGVIQEANDAPFRWLLNELHGAWRRVAKDFADLQAALGLDNHLFVASIDRVRRRLEVAEKPHHAMTDDIVHKEFIFYCVFQFRYAMIIACSPICRQRFPMRDVLQEFMTFNREFARRSAELMRIKIARMAESPFAFFRGSYHLFARDVLQRDLIPLPILTESGAEMDLVGDIHSENYGTYKATDGLIHYDINDFDETTRGRFDVDVCRFAANIVLSAQERKDPLDNQVAAVLAGLSSYLQTLQGGLKKGKNGDLDIFEKNPSGCDAIAQLIQQKSEVKRSRFIADLTEEQAGKRQIKRSFRKYFNLTDAEKTQAQRLLGDFHTRWKEAPTKKDFFDILDICGRISGIGSMGRHRYVVLIIGKAQQNDQRNVLLEFKEARPSAYDLYRDRETAPEALVARAEKVATCERLSQAASSPYLGYAIDGATSFQVREISPHADRVDGKNLKSASFIEVIKVQAAILARTHVRASARVEGPTNPLPELADADRLRQRILAFALGYADIVHRDWARFVGARGDLENIAKWAG